MLSPTLPLLFLCGVLAQTVTAVPYKDFRAFESVKRQAAPAASTTDPLRVDLGYSIYEGTTNATAGLNIWRGIRFAQAPIGNLRWQPPQRPLVNRTQVMNATAFAPTCPQSGTAPYRGPSCPGLANSTTLPASCGNSTTLPGSEDCLSLSVYAPANKTGLPVMVWIHGGGYGAGNGRQDLTTIINANNNGFVGVAIQYRLGAFGFLSSDEVARYGTPNAGIYDQHFALQWVQSYISLFGGDPTRVTITGESAGGGSVMLQTMAYGGTQGDYLFQNSISASPYLPMQYGYADFIPSQAYYAFATAVGCFNGQSISTNTTSIFACLQSKDTYILQEASAIVSGEGLSGTWGFLPTTDGKLIQQIPSQQLNQQRVNGLRVLTGNNANEGVLFTPQNIRTEAALVAWLQVTFPLFTAADISKVLLYYPSPNASVNTALPLFSTLGDMGPTAVNQSDFATGVQQVADNIYSETTFVCPSYWLAASQAQRGEGHASYKYQYSVPPAMHGADVTGYFGGSSLVQSPDFQLAFQRIWGNFIINNDPSISALVANGASTNNTLSTSSNAMAASMWPQYTLETTLMLNLNATGGMPVRVNSSSSVAGSYVQDVGPGVMNNFEVVDAYTWEGGRGTRCDFWLGMGPVVPG